MRKAALAIIIFVSFAVIFISSGCEEIRDIVDEGITAVPGSTPSPESTPTADDNLSVWVNYTTANGLPSNWSYAIVSEGNNIFVGTYEGLGISRDHGKSWIAITTADGLADNKVNDISGSIYLTTLEGLSVSTDGGRTWKTILSDLGSLNLLSVYADKQTVIVGYYQNFLHFTRFSISTDGGNTWNHHDPPSYDESDYAVNAITKGNGRIWAATAIGILVSDDGGDRWQWIDIWEEIAYDGLNGITDIDVAGNLVVVSTYDGPYISKDSGVSWKSYDTHEALKNATTTAVLIDGNTIYLGSYDGGLFISEDGGNSWMQYSTADGIADNLISDIYVANGVIYLATQGGISIWDTTADR